jgi:HAD superfamily hydrolase (TIGR01509 family)
MPLEALIFDVDGTLAETEETHRLTFNEAFHAAGLDWDWTPDLYRDLLQITGGKERIRHYIKAYKPPGGEAALEQLLALHADAAKRYAAYVASGAIAPRPGVMRLIGEARANGLRLAIATTSTPGSVAAMLQVFFGAEAKTIFEVIAAGDVVANKKPAPDVYLYALKELGLPAAACVVFEDSHKGVVAARGAGLAVVATPSFYLSADDLSAATSIVSDLGEPDAPNRLLAGQPLCDDDGYVSLAGLQALLKA